VKPANDFLNSLKRHPWRKCNLPTSNH